MTDIALFPPRPEYLSEDKLKKELVLSGVSPELAKESTILLKKELAILWDLAKGNLKCSAKGLLPTRIVPMKVSKNNTEIQRKIAEERKARMIAFDEERHANGVGSSMEDMEREILRRQQVEIARDKMNENLDEVKGMEQVIQNAKCATVRDAQVLEKKAIAAEQAEEERRQDMMMELERLKAIRMYEEREAKRIEDQKKGAAIIHAQIEEREQDRLRKMELRQQEQEAMLRHVEQMRQEDLAEAQRRMENARTLMEDVALSNAEQIRLKAKQEEMEQEEERRIAEFIREKEKRDQEYADEQARIKMEKDREVNKLRTVQQKFMDKQAELDEIRARRDQEAREREERMKERERRERQAAINEDLAAAHEHQRHEREMLLAEQARQEQEEFDRIILVQKRAEEQERLMREREKKLREDNALALQKQIAEIEEQRRRARREQLEEGQNDLAEQRERAAIVEEIRKRKLDELEHLQVPKQYRQELMKKKDTSNRLRPAK